MPLTTGTKLGSHDITALLGKGGMGEVYRARDTKLKRDVAIKIMPDAFSRDPDRLSRFQREAEVLASLNHPNIAAIYDLQEANDSRFLVLELVEGETLAERIKRGPVPIDEALGFAKSICEALEAAHEKNIVHRDLKPANVKVTPEGKVKVLDFGLAKAFAEEKHASDIQNAPTESASPTIQGVILGTAAYMSPEQARGKTVDKRTDIWAFGCVLYELLTAQRAFYGEDTTETLAAVLKGEPDWAALPASTPSNIRVLLRRCLQKDIARRLRDATDARIEVEDALAASSAALPTAPAISTPPAWRRMLPIATAVFSSVVVGIAAWNLKPAPAPDARPVARLTIALPPNATFEGRLDANVTQSPDGRHVVYVANRAGAAQQLYVRPLDAMEATPLAGTENAYSPFFSPDGQWIAFFSTGKLKKISVNGGAVLTLCNAGGGSGGSWGADDTIVFAPTLTSGLLKVSAAGGEPKPFTTLQQGDVGQRWPQFLPDGKTVLFNVGGAATADDAEIAVQPLDSGERKVILRGGAFPRYAPTGHLLYYRAGTIMAAPFDAKRLEVTGPSAPVVEAVLGEPRTGAVQFSLSNPGSMAYVSGGPQSATLTMVWVDRRGIAQPLAAPLRSYRAPRLSPDGRRVAVGIGADLWIYDIPRDTLTRFTFDGQNAANAAVWTPDGKHVVFPSSKANEPQNISWKLADGSAPEERLTTGQNQVRIGSFSPDGQTMIYTMIDPKTSNDLWVMPLDGDRKPRVFLQTPSNESSGLISPDGRWVAYSSDESGRLEIYVRPFSGSGGKYQISNDGGSEAAWSPKGNELFYRTGGQHEKMMAVDVQTQPNFVAGKPHLLFEQPYIAGAGSGAQYSVSPDGQRFLMLKQPDQQQTSLTQINVVLNWFEELKQKVPTRK